MLMSTSEEAQEPSMNQLERQHCRSVDVRLPKTDMLGLFPKGTELSRSTS